MKASVDAGHVDGGRVEVRRVFKAASRTAGPAPGPGRTASRTMIMEIKQLISCGIDMIMKNSFDHAWPARGYRVPARAPPSRSPPAAELRGSG